MEITTMLNIVIYSVIIYYCNIVEICMSYKMMIIKSFRF